MAGHREVSPGWMVVEGSPGSGAEWERKGGKAAAVLPFPQQHVATHHYDSRANLHALSHSKFR